MVVGRVEVYVAKVFYKKYTPYKWQPKVLTVNPKYPDNWESIRQRILTRDGRRCQLCGSTVNIRVHHKVPLSRGGTNADTNLITLCEDCHTQQHMHLLRRKAVS